MLIVLNRLVFVVVISITAVHAAGAQRNPRPPLKVDRIVVYKKAHTLVLMRGGKALRSYKVALGDPFGNKIKAGDRKTPEGQYVIDGMKSRSRFYRALHISYPNAADRERARRLGVNPGGDIEIHGLPKALTWIGELQHRWDWTSGCIAVTDKEMDEIWPQVSVGTPVDIRP